MPIVEACARPIDTGHSSPPNDRNGLNSQQRDLPLHHYCILRNDLPPGVAAAQLLHASGQSARLLEGPPDVLDGSFAITLAAKDEADLDRLACQLEKAGIPLRRIVEEDAPYTGSLMAIGLAPAKKRDLKKYLSSYPLWKGGTAT